MDRPNELQRACTFLPQITQGQQSLLERFEPRITRIHDIRVYDCDPSRGNKPTGLWEFDIQIGDPFLAPNRSGRGVIWVAVDGAMVASVASELSDEPRRSRGEPLKFIGVGRKLHNWGRPVLGPKIEVEEERDNAGYMSMGREYQYNLYNKHRVWAMNEVKCRVWLGGRGDFFGRVWPEEFPIDKRCAICGQPDLDWLGSGWMCHHEKITSEQVEQVKEDFQNGKV